MTQFGENIFGSGIFGVIIEQPSKKEIKKPPELPRVYDKFETDFNHSGLAVLENAYKVKITEVLNGEFILSFFIPIKDEKFQYIQEENYVKVDGQIFIIKKIKKQRTEEGKLLAEIFCEHVSYELLDFYLEPVTYENQTISYIAGKILENTPFSLQYTELDYNIDFNFEGGNRRKALFQLLQQIDGEVIFDNYNIAIVEQRGQNLATEFRVGKNIKKSVQEKSSDEIITRLYVFGKNGLTIESVNNGLKYIDSDNINDFKYPKEKAVYFNDIDNPNELLQAGQKYLQENNQTKVIYNIDIIDLSKIYPVEKFSLGDTCRVLDEELSISVTARIMQYEYYPYDYENTKVVLGNYQENIVNTIDELQDTKSKIDNLYNKGVITPKNTLSSQWLEGAIDTATNQILSGGGYIKQDARGLLILDNPNENLAQNVIRINENGIGLSTTGISGEFRTAMTAEGIVADRITSGQLSTSLVKIFGDTHFYWDTNGIYIQDPADTNKYITIDKNGIRYTTDDGNTFDIEIGWNGSNIITEGKEYSKVKITSENGIEVFDANNNERLKIADLGSGKYGIQIKKADGTVTFDVKSDGTVSIIDGSIDITHSDGSESILDANGLQVIFEKDAYGNPYSYTIYDANGQRRYLKGKRVATFFVVGSGDGWTDNVLENLSYGDTIDYYVYVFLDLIGEAWHELATIYNQVLNDTSKTETERKNILSQILTASCMAIEDNGEPDNYNYLQTRTAEFLTKQIATSGIYVPEIIAVDVNDTVAKDSRSSPSYRTIDFRGAVMRAKGYAKYTHNGGTVWWTFYKDVRIIMQANGTLDVDF
ncbi:hypothetical protein H0A61_02165 [Koleobacter methoxysyntrophicus]|uniref:Uncharacterized protein n=1 Tax=Koleobacter methoxysyntrophicus TaxID=2751313 RepID=A0A8A0RPE1_9FIRM|nr:phage tail spike protein [Koleobacter methoxysyntrophicus]QSQ09784.1 hypothetical protein H0A61_02165 [Koleobacter methoxysyntrophicus]